jgi:acetyltransferase-like isoleucine patch superfamily enzyme
MVRRTIARLLYKVITSPSYKGLVLADALQENADFLRHFKFIGERSQLPKQAIIKNPQYIHLGENFVALQNLRLEAWDEYDGQRFSPEIFIGNNVIFNTDVHIGCINRVFIGNNVMLASRIYISDHSHGDIDAEALQLVPSRRPLVSKGPVIIEENVWIGEGACILPNVVIGKNSIVGANAVVTKSFPPNSIIAGVPGRLLKVIK